MKGFFLHEYRVLSWAEKKTGKHRVFILCRAIMKALLNYYLCFFWPREDFSGTGAHSQTYKFTQQSTTQVVLAFSYGEPLPPPSPSEVEKDYSFESEKKVHHLFWQGLDDPETPRYRTKYARRNPLHWSHPSGQNLGKISINAELQEILLPREGSRRRWEL